MGIFALRLDAVIRIGHIRRARREEKMNATKSPADSFQTILTHYLYIGMTDSVTACDCCGRSDLKRTMALYDAVLGEEVYFGTSCGARALSMPVKVLNAEINAIERRRVEEANRARAAKWEAEKPLYDAFHDWACKQTGEIAACRAWPKLGGFRAAEAAYREQGGMLP